MSMNRYIFIAALASMLALAYSCDRRGGPITGIETPPSQTQYTLEIVPESEITLPDLTLKIACFVRDASGSLVGGKEVHFRAFTAATQDSIYITEHIQSSGTDTSDGLTGNLYFYVRGNVGEIKLVAFTYVSDTTTSMAKSDTASILSVPYAVEFASMVDTVYQSQSVQLLCDIFNPFSMSRVNGKHIAFEVLDAGDVNPTEALTDTSNFNGMDVNVLYTSPVNLTGDFYVAAHAIWMGGVSGNKIMGSDTLTITVVDN